MSKIVAAGKLLNQISANTGKPWPRPNGIIGAGANGVVFSIGPKVMKMTLGNATRETDALRKLKTVGATFVPKISNNYISIRKANNNIRSTLFPNGWNEHEKTTTYIMNKVGNATLWRYVKGGRLPNGRILSPHRTNTNKRQIRAELVKAIKFMHAHGISHGDLHAGNILVELGVGGKMKKLWIIDFGRYINIPKGKTENNAYRNLAINHVSNNVNIFNTAKKPQTAKYLAYSTVSRRNMNMLKAMGLGNNSPGCDKKLGCFSGLRRKM